MPFNMAGFRRARSYSRRAAARRARSSQVRRSAASTGPAERPDVRQLPASKKLLPRITRSTAQVAPVLRAICALSIESTVT
jgi:hypothetical protein